MTTTEAAQMIGRLGGRPKGTKLTAKQCAAISAGMGRMYARRQAEAAREAALVPPKQEPRP